MSRSHHHQTVPARLKPPSARAAAIFSCGIFGNCTHAALSPTAAAAPAPAAGFAAAAVPPVSPKPAPCSPSPPPPVPPHPQPSSSNFTRPHPSSSSSSSSSSSASQSFTQWRLPVHHHHPSSPSPPLLPSPAPDVLVTVEQHFNAGDSITALRLLERALSPQETVSPLPAHAIAGVVACLKEAPTARAAAKVLLAMLLAEANRKAAVDEGAAEAAVDAVAASVGTATAERALAALELLCTVPEGAAKVRRHEGAAQTLARAVETMGGRGRECGIGVLTAIYSNAASAGEAGAPPPEVARAVVSAMQGECSARGRRKGAQLLRALQGSGRLGFDWDDAVVGC